MYASSSEPGLVAPGMHVSLQVTFTPASLADLASRMLLETEQGTLEVPLLARRQPPKADPAEGAVGGTHPHRQCTGETSKADCCLC